jgi:hypothetical protein
MLHFCPQCRQHYDCQPGEKLFLASPHLPHGFRCGTPDEWRCPECATKIAILTGEKPPVSTSFVYKASSRFMTFGPCVVPRGGDHCDFCCTPPVFKVYRCANFSSKGNPVFVSGLAVGSWATCRKCAELVDRGKWSDLTDRALRKFVKGMVSPVVRSLWFERNWRRLAGYLPTMYCRDNPFPIMLDDSHSLLCDAIMCFT